jgi:predicted glycoside hydrolase/deacetylase ChbG (UPF0249 family)
VAGTRVLIVNADDFGQTDGINRGIARAHEHGIVTSASLMTRFPAAAAAAEYAQAHPKLSVGLHVDLGEWAYRDGDWRPIYDFPVDDHDLVAAEVAAQLEAFRTLMGTDPTHLDSHQHAHQKEPVHSIVLAHAAELGVPVRHYDDRVAYCSGFYGGGRRGESYPEQVGVDHLLEILRSLPEGITELGCHPGEAAGLDSSYLHERELEVETLCDPAVRRAVEEEGIVLTSFRDALTLVT